LSRTKFHVTQNRSHLDLKLLFETVFRTMNIQRSKIGWILQTIYMYSLSNTLDMRHVVSLFL